MFDGVPDQFHQFIASSRTSLPIPFPFPLHAATTTTTPPPPLAPTFSTFDPYPPHQTLHPHSLHHLPTPPPPKNEPAKENHTTFLSTSLALERERSTREPPRPWSNEEVLALLRIRSSMENWFPDFTWEHVSRKLAEVGFTRCAEKCKERFEEESRNLNSRLSFNKSYNLRFFSELDEVYQQQQSDQTPHISSPHQNTHHNSHEESPPTITQHQQGEDSNKNNNSHQVAQSQSFEGGGEEEGLVDDYNMSLSNNNNDENEEAFTMMRRGSTTTTSSNSNNNKAKKNRKRKHEFEMFKGFCEAIVERIMTQQEELHNKIIEDMMKREEEKIARDEAWKSQEMDRVNKEMEIREKEQEIASNRQAKMIELFNKFSSSPHSFSLLKNELLEVTQHTPYSKKRNPSSPSPSSTYTLALAPTSTDEYQTLDTTTTTPSSAHNGGGDHTGKRWPREEVLALINMRCSLNNSTDDNKGPLWERISQGMQELGYTRSAKRCKEKWENINKYFRKTKDNNKKRSLDSRTCPYFQQLSTLYCQGKLREASPDNGSRD